MTGGASSGLTLDTLPPGEPVRVVGLLGGRELQRRLLALGLRLGSVVTVVQHRGRGLVVSQGETRIALGGGVAEKIRVERLAGSAPEDPR